MVGFLWVSGRITISGARLWIRTEMSSLCVRGEWMGWVLGWGFGMGFLARRSIGFISRSLRFLMEGLRSLAAGGLICLFWLGCLSESTLV